MLHNRPSTHEPSEHNDGLPEIPDERPVYPIQTGKTRSASSGFYTDYTAMKERIRLFPRRVPSVAIGGLQPRHHLTERDVHATYDADDVPFCTALGLQIRQVYDRYLSKSSWWKKTLRSTFPIVDAARRYKLEYLGRDIAAGVAVGVSAIPIGTRQIHETSWTPRCFLGPTPVLGMSYSLMARFPPQNGLYQQLFFSIIYMVFGTGQLVSVGANGVESLMTANALAALVGWDASEEVWLNAGIGMAFTVGIILITMRFLGLGLVRGTIRFFYARCQIASFLADPVVSGFSTGCAVIIAISQLPHFFGIHVPRASTLRTLTYIISHLNTARWLAVVIALVALCALTAVAYVNSRWLTRCPVPGALVIMVFAILFGYCAKIDTSSHAVPIIGVVPRGLPAPRTFNFDMDLWGNIWKQAFPYAIVYFCMHSSISKSIARRHGLSLDCNQELLATGICSFSGSFFQCYPVSTSMARTSIAVGSGAMTQFYNIGNAVTVVLALTVLTPLLYYMPMAALAAVVLFGLYRMMDFREAFRLLRLFSTDFLLWIACFTVTVFLGAIEGIIASIVLSLLWIVKEGAFPSTGLLGRLPGTNIYRDIKTIPEAREIPGCKILRFDAPLNFSNADHFQKKVFQLAGIESTPDATQTKSGFRQQQQPNVAGMGECLPTQCSGVSIAVSGRKFTEDASEDHQEIRVVIIDASSITRVDVTAVRMLQGVAERLKHHGISLLFCNWKGPMRSFLQRIRFYSIIPPDHCFLSINDAVAWAEVFYLNRPARGAMSA